MSVETGAAADKQIERSGEGEKPKRGRIENLIMWKPGQSGNPKGRPKKPTISELMRVELEKGIKGAGMVKLEAFVQRAVNDAIGGKEWAWKEVGDRLDPKPRRVEISGPDGGPIQLDDRAAADLEVKLGSFLKAVRRKEPVTVEAQATRLTD